MQADVLAEVFEQAPDAMILSDLDGNILLWNRAAATMFGHDADAALGHSLDMIIPERFRAAHWAGFRRAVETGVEKYHGQVMTTRAVHADGGKVYVDLSFGMIRDAAGAVRGVLAIARPNNARNAAAS
ncbi:MAG: PAS domain S-box protein [Gammaproteobacteria bacterium]|jgi:PAS domain S-box-containing protein|nr:PAS domain S-box protein [Gammaproteobacteria bacterium]